MQLSISSYSNPARKNALCTSCCRFLFAPLSSSSAIQFPAGAAQTNSHARRPWEQLEASPWHSSPRLGSFRSPGCIMDGVDISESIKERARVYACTLYILSLSLPLPLPLYAFVFSSCNRSLVPSRSFIFSAHHRIPCLVYLRSLWPAWWEAAPRHSTFISWVKVASRQNDLRRQSNWVLFVFACITAVVE